MFWSANTWYKGDFNYLSFTCTQKGPCIRAGHEEQGAARDVARSRRTGWVKRSHWKTSLRNLDCWKILVQPFWIEVFHYHPPECHLHALMLFGYVYILYIIYKGMIGYLWGCVRCSCRPIVVLFMLHTHTQRHTKKGRILLVIQTIQEEHDMVKCAFEIPVQFYWHWKW